MVAEKLIAFAVVAAVPSHAGYSERSLLHGLGGQDGSMLNLVEQVLC